MSKPKVPGARVGDFVFAARKGPVPLPPIDEFAPDLRADYEWNRLRRQLADDPDLKNDGNFAGDMTVALYDFITSGLPEEYLDAFNRNVSSRDMERLFTQWAEANGGVGPGESSTS